MNNADIRDISRAMHISINAVVRVLKTLGIMCNDLTTILIPQ
ncbi:transposase [Xenorhabdus ishibashii]|uniref:Transposase n=1 Tax=Xenorhabdus ishibashii TaxID=1034471 RepID=A0A2D0KDP0_9GAMM|nr:transposase [Xenorhabdus ishibashii]